MKRMIKTMLATAVATASLLPVTASAEVEKLGLAVANLQANFFNQIKQSVEAYGEEKGIEVITVDARGDSATQVSQVQDLLTQNIDALIYIPAGAAAATVPARLARAEGVPIVNIDRNPEGAPGDTFITTDSVSSAYQVCKHIIEQAGGKGQMLMIHGQKGTTPELERTEGCNNAIAEYDGVELVEEQWSNMWSQDEGFQITQNLLQAHPDVNIIFAQADGLALGAAQAIKVSDMPQRIYVGGFDGDTAALEAIRDGVFDVTATQQTQLMGRLAVDSAIKLVNGEGVDAENRLDATLTTKENVEAFIAEHP